MSDYTLAKDLDPLRSICADCTEDQRIKCRASDKGCDEFYTWRSKHVAKLLSALDKLNQEDTK